MQMDLAKRLSEQSLQLGHFSFGDPGDVHPVTSSYKALHDGASQRSRSTGDQHGSAHEGTFGGRMSEIK